MPKPPPPPPPQQEALFAPADSAGAPPPKPRRPRNPRAREKPVPQPAPESAFGEPSSQPAHPSRNPGERQPDDPKPAPSAGAPRGAPAPAPSTDTASKGTAGRPLFTVSRLNDEVRRLLEGSLRSVWVTGEISNLGRPPSGHIYFTLKDARAQVRCAMFRNRARLAPPLKDGAEVIVRGQVTLYPARGDYQIQVETVEETGEGALRRAFDELKRRLDAQGLFAPDRKRPLPSLPRRIGVLSSPTGAAIRDVLHVLARRFPAVPVRLYPIAVQGDAAPPAIVHMLGKACARRDCDVLLLTRGGGSLEDLWAFNDERVARAIAACDIPVISAVGHEIDFTIADFVADQRAPTPSAAAEMLVPDRSVWLRDFAAAEARLTALLRRQQRSAAEQLRWLAGRLAQQHPRTRVRQSWQRGDELGLRLERLARAHLDSQRQRCQSLEARLHALAPARRLGEAQGRLRDLQVRLERVVQQQLRVRTERLRHLSNRLGQTSPTRTLLPSLKTREETLARRLSTAMNQRLQQDHQRLMRNAETLRAVSPLATLSRGYAIVHRLESEDDAHRASAPIVRSATALAPGDLIRARFGEGTALARVVEVSTSTETKAGGPQDEPPAEQGAPDTTGDAGPSGQRLRRRR